VPKERLIALFWALVFLVVLCPAAAGSGRANEKFLIIHLDAVSSLDFFRELEAGNIPNIASAFEEGHHVRYGLSLYPGGTEIIYPRLKSGWDNSVHHTVGWGYLNRETGEIVGDIQVFLEMFRGFPRRNRHQFLLGLPVLRHLAGLSLLNVPRLLETQDVVEFFWFNTDVMGHLLGKDAHLESLYWFDYYFGLLLDSGKLNNVNLVLYSDHGMTTHDVQVINHNSIISEVLGEHLLYFAYPNVYLVDPGKKMDVAKIVGAHPQIDLALTMPAHNKVLGYHNSGVFEVNMRDGEFQYLYEEEDLFDYSSLNYDGAFLSKEDWLSLTREHRYPGVPPNIFSYLSNPNTGDIVIVLNPPRIPYAIRAQRGNHAGLLNTDTQVPLLLFGPAFRDLDSFEEFWLHELYSVHLSMIDFQAQPYRENHCITLLHPSKFDVVLSPTHRWRFGAVFSEMVIEPFLEVDLYSSFLTRLWVGSGVANGRLNLQFRVEAFLSDWSIEWLKRPNSDSHWRFFWRIHDQIEAVCSNSGIGFRFFF